MRSCSAAGTRICATVVVIFLTLLLAGCGDDSQQTRETLTSWSKSLDLLEQQYAERRVPETYVRQMLRAATRALNQQREVLSNDPATRDLDAKIRRISTSVDNTSAAKRLAPVRRQ